MKSIAALTLGSIALMSAGAAFASDFRVAFDQAKVIRLEAPAKTVVVGNPLIADATMIDDRTVYVLGRMFGQTNLVAVDADGNEVLNTPVSVTMPDQQMVTLYRGNVPPRTHSCAPRCEWMLKQGDEGHKTLLEDTQAKQGASVDAAKVARGGN